MAGAEAAERKLSACCISHEFYKAVSKFPDKIAVIHASGFARHCAANRLPVGDSSKFAAVATASSSQPPVYDGDECFTFFDILSAVENLSSRLWLILHGADDSYLIKTGSVNIVREKSEHVSESLHYSSQSVQQSTKFRNVHTPKVENIKEQSLPLLLGWPCESESLISFCYVMYTSGSSGKPKGVCGTEIGLLNRFLWMQEMYPLHEGDVVLFKTAISFIDHMQEFLGAVLSTCTLVIPPSNLLKENIFYVVDFLQGYFINRLVAVPSLMRAILPCLQNPRSITIQGSLKLLVLSGEVLHLSLCKMLLKLLPETSILNLYGSTELAYSICSVCPFFILHRKLVGDCTYFDCKRLPLILEKEVLSSVPVGLPVSNCDVVLAGEDAPYQGEIYVGGLCVAAGYFDYPHLIPLADGGVSSEHDIRGPSSGCRFQITLKLVNGQRIALEEIEGAFRDHPDVVDAAVLSREFDGEMLLLESHVVTEETSQDDEFLKSSLRNWVLGKLPHVMIPSHILFTRSLPLTSSGKVDYLSLAASTTSNQQARINIEEIRQDNLIEVIKKVPLANQINFKHAYFEHTYTQRFLTSAHLHTEMELGGAAVAPHQLRKIFIFERSPLSVFQLHPYFIHAFFQVFSDALMVENVSVDDDFFVMGGNSMSAAYVSFKLGIHMKLLYTFPTPLRLQMALFSSGSSVGTDAFLGVDLRRPGGMLLSSEPKIPNFHGSKPQGRLFGAESNGDIYTAKKLKTQSNTYEGPSEEQNCDDILWNPTAVHTECSFSRCNKSTHRGQCERNYSCETVWSNIITRDGKGFMRELWKVDLNSCVDASPLVVFKGSDIYLFIGSHSHKFVCLHGRSLRLSFQVLDSVFMGWDSTKLFYVSKVSAGVFKLMVRYDNGKPYFLVLTADSVRKKRKSSMCGSYDHNLYAIDYKSYCCIYKLPCGGSIFGSPAINEVQETLYVASTSGHVTALEIKTPPFKTLWKQDMGAPVFGSLSINCSDGNIICCLVDGTVVVLSTYGSIIWKVRTGGPIFAGPCTSQALPTQVLICSRDGNIYSFEMETGNLIWKHAIGRPITSSPYVDEISQLASNISNLSDRLICVCDSSGSIYVLRVHSNATGCVKQNMEDMVHEFARLDLQGDVFSSPVMIGGRIFVGCRDDHVYCVQLDVD
ncbi:hypothetical protein DH2020_023431 [Rehmannia glutinosa]|uniref:4-coumarate--CoA ligase n=1 Tax=Rehmannia glutinosa TaxID=99300 RepID=A0ABR0W611_REHGL